MANIGFIVPDREMLNTARTVIDQSNEKVDIEMNDTDFGLQSANRFIKRGAKVIVARGGTALMIRKKFQIPVIEIPVTVEDIAEAILKASQLGEFVAIIGFENILKGFERFNSLFKIRLEQVYIEQRREIEPAILKLKAQGAQVIIGGRLQCQLAEKYQLKTVLLQSGAKAIGQALQEAEHVLATLLKERQRAEEIRAILNLAREAYVAIDKSGKITLTNSAAQKFLAYCPKQLVGKKLSEVFPGLSNLCDVIQTGEEHCNDITTIEKRKVLYNRIPIRVDQTVTGAIATFQDICTIQEAESKIRNNFWEKGWYANYTLLDIKGSSPKIKQALRYAEKFSQSDSTVIITGESGVGKEMFAQGIHRLSRRKNGPFVGINCAALPEGILESELFGYTEGAFTGARKTGKMGLFEMAHHGTIFLDEISEIPIALQGHLLRVLQEKKVMRLGDNRVIPVDVRVIVASNRNLPELVAQKKFREDLFFRLNVLRLNIPPLRERKEDIPILIEKFLSQSVVPLAFRPEAMQALCCYLWPGNIRELNNLLERLTVLSSPQTPISQTELEEMLRENEALITENVKQQHLFSPATLTLESIHQALETVHGNKAKAAELLGIHRSTLWRRLRDER